MKIALVQQNYIIGDLEYNYNKIVKGIQEAKANGAELCVFSELSLTGYPPQDNFSNPYFIQQCQYYLNKIMKYAYGIVIVVGAIDVDKKKKKVYNAAFVFQNKKTFKIVHKTLLPNYDVFNERRYFVEGKSIEIIRIKKSKIALTVCEDIWNDSDKYDKNPLHILHSNKVDYIINISASPFHYAQHEKRLNIIRKQCSQYKTCLLYCNTIGAQSDLIFDGGSLIVNKKGVIVQQAKFFQEDILYFNDSIQNVPTTYSKPTQAASPLILFKNEIYAMRILDALILGIRDYLKKTSFTKVILGTSGGIDSAVVQALLTIALGKENVFAVAMPSQFSSTHSVKDAIQLSKNLGNEYYLIPIKNKYELFVQSLEKIWGKKNKFSLAEENLQSRIRGNILMTLANKYNYLLINTSNKSELAMGYGTLYGDMAGALSVLGDLYKTQIYALSLLINKHYKNIVPQNIIDKAPSAELRPHQKDTDSLPEYEILDSLLYYFIEQNLSPHEIEKKNVFDTTMIYKIHKAYVLNEYKRNQFCPILRVSPKSFGRGRKFEIVAKNI